MKKVFKKTMIAIISSVIILSMAGCSNETEQKEPVAVAALNGPTGMGMVKLIEDSEEGKTDLDYDFTLTGSPDNLNGKIISGEVDIAAVPTNLAMTLHNRTEGQIQLAAVNTLGVLYVLENGNSINAIEDLKGKTVNVSGRGSMPDFLFQYLLSKNNLQINDDVTVDFNLEHADLAAAVAEEDIDIALLPQPHVTTAMMRNENAKIALDITEEWEKVSDGRELIMGVIIVQREFAENNKELLDNFLDEYKQSIEFANQNVDETAELIEKYEILPNAQIAKNAIPYSNIVYRDASEAKESLQEIYEVLYSFEPRSVGGKIADEEFYYER
ncbi:ABC transporter substrate-binding protein [Herbivorax sp. ANBcel31]|uniref:ABC transporter substrate-binding protein n=1 Tax=Herbivorax sp. ANBcel31 TaxID=3069754 RepID=UPI0027B5261C|nr:ABC transporter substrate-binding protein [Herbivorax sp. ANBcel31]MDQ2085231.1 ABC transporter substrate-binding protein [Herbivorax sp. ANBcel31]